MVVILEKDKISFGSGGESDHLWVIDRAASGPQSEKPDALEVGSLQTTAMNCLLSWTLVTVSLSLCSKIHLQALSLVFPSPICTRLCDCLFLVSKMWQYSSLSPSSGCTNCKETARQWYLLSLHRAWIWPWSYQWPLLLERHRVPPPRGMTPSHRATGNKTHRASTTHSSPHIWYVPVHAALHSLTAGPPVNTMAVQGQDPVSRVSPVYELEVRESGAGEGEAVG